MTMATKILPNLVNTPAPHPDKFVGEIIHPNLWLWDSWTVRVDSILHLYCLGLARVNSVGEPITVFEFNDYPFHFRHFVSDDNGETWQDHGAVLHPGNLSDGSDSGNVWSGSVHKLASGEILFGYTGIEHKSPTRKFVQTINFAIGGVDGPTIFPSESQSHPVRDREAIIQAGYYLPEEDRIGHNDGEGDGPILAWRDPFIYETDAGVLHAFWSAKVEPRVPAVAYAILEKDGNQWIAKLQAPIRLPDETEYTQAEVPKLCIDKDTGDYLLMISSCNRLHEQQSDKEITKGLRLYRSNTITGPWTSVFEHGSLIHGVDHLFGASFVDREISEKTANLIAPYTVKIGGDRPMTFAPIQTVHLG